MPNNKKWEKGVFEIQRGTNIVNVESQLFCFGTPPAVLDKPSST